MHLLQNSGPPQRTPATPSISEALRPAGLAEAVHMRSRFRQIWAVSQTLPTAAERIMIAPALESSTRSVSSLARFSPAAWHLYRDTGTRLTSFTVFQSLIVWQ